MHSMCYNAPLLVNVLSTCNATEFRDGSFCQLKHITFLLLTPTPAMQVLSEKLDVVHLTFYTAPISLLCLMPFYQLYEVRLACVANISRFQLDGAVSVGLIA